MNWWTLGIRGTHKQCSQILTWLMYYNRQPIFALPIREVREASVIEMVGVQPFQVGDAKAHMTVQATPIAWVDACAVGEFFWRHFELADGAVVESA